MIPTEHNFVNLAQVSGYVTKTLDIDWEFVSDTRCSESALKPPKKFLSDGYNLFGADVFESVLKASGLLIRHKNSGRVNPLWAAFHYIGWQCHRGLDACIAKREKIGSELKSFGYDKNLKDKQTGRHRATLRRSGLITITGRGKLKECKLTLIGEIVYWFYVKQNAGLKKIKFNCPVDNFNRLVAPVKKMSRDNAKKCPVIDKSSSKGLNLALPPISPKGEQADPTCFQKQKTKEGDKPKKIKRIKPPVCQIPKLFPKSHANAAYANLKSLSIENIAFLCALYDSYANKTTITYPLCYLKRLVNRMNSGEFKSVNPSRLITFDRSEEIKIESRKMAIQRAITEGISDPSKVTAIGKRMDYDEYQKYLVVITGYEELFRRQLNAQELNKST